MKRGILPPFWENLLFLEEGLFPLSFPPSGIIHGIIKFSRSAVCSAYNSEYTNSFCPCIQKCLHLHKWRTFQIFLAQFKQVCYWWHWKCSSDEFCDGRNQTISLFMCGTLTMNCQCKNLPHLTAFDRLPSCFWALQFLHFATYSCFIQF